VIKNLSVPDDYKRESQVHRDFLITLYKTCFILWQQEWESRTCVCSK